MKLVGLVKSSLIDYPGKVAAVIFTQGCNFRCGFCHNPDLIRIENLELEVNYSEKEILDFLKSRIGKLDGVVITGGEPLIQPDLEGFIAKIKAMGYAIKLDTNGSSPEKLKHLIDSKLVDYVAMDIKGTFAKYGQICSYLNTKVIQQSVKLLTQNEVDYEFRTTVVPCYHDPEDFELIGQIIQGAKVYTIQNFRPQITLDKNLNTVQPFTLDELNSFSEIIAPYVQKVVIHNNR